MPISSKHWAQNGAGSSTLLKELSGRSLGSLGKIKARATRGPRPSTQRSAPTPRSLVTLPHIKVHTTVNSRIIKAKTSRLASHHLRHHSHQKGQRAFMLKTYKRLPCTSPRNRRTCSLKKEEAESVLQRTPSIGCIDFSWAGQACRTLTLHSTLSPQLWTISPRASRAIPWPPPRLLVGHSSVKILSRVNHTEPLCSPQIWPKISILLELKQLLL